MSEPLKVLDLFSGIGGLALGLHRAGMESAAFCEIDPFCRRVLAKHWPTVPAYSDVRALNGRDFQFDLIAGGPPCQRTSLAAAISGKRTGETLWPEMLRVGLEGRARWWLVEQPPGNAGWEATVKGDLARDGFHSARLQRSALSCGAPHLRRRVFIVARALRERCEAVARLGGSPAAQPGPWPAPPRGTWYSRQPRDRRVANGLSSWMDRLKGLGNAVVPQVAEQIGRAILAAEADGAASEAAKVRTV